MRELKKSATKWVHETIDYPRFEWQEGYAAFSVIPTGCESVLSYIANQKEHHRTRSFREELISMLEKAGVEFDAKYLE